MTLEIMAISNHLGSPYNLRSLGERFRRTRDQLLFRIKEFNVEEVTIWGAGKNGEMVIQLLQGSEVKIKRIYDQKSNFMLHGIRVMGEHPIIAAS